MCGLNAPPPVTKSPAGPSPGGLKNGIGMKPMLCEELDELEERLLRFFFFFFLLRLLFRLLLRLLLLPLSLLMSPPMTTGALLGLAAGFATACGGAALGVGALTMQMSSSA